MSIATARVHAMGLLSGLCRFVKANKALWVPMLIVVLLFGGLLILNPPGAPLFGFAVF